MIILFICCVVAFFIMKLCVLGGTHMTISSIQSYSTMIKGKKTA